MAEVLSEVTTTKRLFEPPNHELWAKGSKFQLNLFQALEAGDAQQARKNMAQHMSFGEKLVHQQELRVERKLSDCRLDCVKV